jgi:hypothetical protein
MLDDLLESNARLQRKGEEASIFVASSKPSFMAELMAAQEASLGSSTALVSALRDGPFGTPETSSEEASSIAEEFMSECQLLQVSAIHNKLLQVHCSTLPTTDSFRHLQSMNFLSND